MVTIQQKKQIVEQLVEEFKRATCYYLVDFTGMTVASSVAFRRELRKQDIKIRVAKNTLILRALKEVGDSAVPEEVLVAPTAIVFGYDDPVAPAKIIKAQSDKFNKPVFKAAVLEGQYFDSKQLNTLASLPGKKDIIASILGSLQAPASGIVGVLNAVVRDLASVIEEVAKTKAA